MSNAAMDSAPKKENSNSKKPIKVGRFFSSDGKHPFDEINWDKRTATITNEKGEVIFEQEDVEVPAFYSQLATKVVVSKYFYGEKGTSERETSLKELIHRVTRTIADWGYQDGLFSDQQQADVYYNELTWLCVNQYAAFNSPVWFNVGLYHVRGVEGSNHNYYWNPDKQAIENCPNTYQYPQGSACFYSKRRRYHGRYHGSGH